MVTLGIQRQRDTGEFRVYYKEDGRDDESKAYYANDWEDAVGTLFLIRSSNKSRGIPTQTSSDRTTDSLIRRFYDA